MIPAVFCWSGGKDSALALYKVLQGKEYDVKYLLTTVNEEFRRVSMHGVREELLDQQASLTGIPLVKIYVSEGTNSEYEKKMEEVLQGFKNESIDHVIFGDIFLEDLKKYREANLAKVKMTGVFPLWKRDTALLAKEFIDLGFKTITCCTNDAFLGREWVGRMVNEQFLLDLPEGVDACGENGEYHTFCFEGPVFKSAISFSAGEKIFKPLTIKAANACDLPAPQTKGFWFCDLLVIP